MKKMYDKFNLARNELLDLSLKNPLINFKLRKTTGLEFNNLNASETFDYIVGEGKNLYFTREKTNLPSKLYVELDEKEIRSRLNRTYRSSRLFLEEKGANTLFLALGFLNWKEDYFEIYYRSPLLLVPVELNKAENSDRYFLNYNGDEIRINISLITKMKNEFNINLEYEDDEIEDVDKYFRFLYEIISKIKPDWSLSTTTGALDFFSYSKFLMYRDLNIDLWVDDKNNLNNEIIDKLFFTNFSDNTNTETKKITYYNVVDADTSQTLAINDIMQGKNLVLQGPPGTGKSQTITNIIANAIANGKSVLFVSEKLAALEVVKKRLENVGLGDLVIELHSQKTNRKEFLKSLEKTLNLGEPKVDDSRNLFARYFSVENDLNQYREIINSPLKNSNLPLIDIYGEALSLKEKIEHENVRLPRISFKNIDKWSYDDYLKRLDIVKEFVSLANKIGKIEKNPLYGISLCSCLPYEQVTLKERICDIEETLNSLVNIINDIGVIFNNKSCNTLFDSKRLKLSIEVLEKYQNLGDVNCSDHRFTNRKFADSIINTCLKLQSFYQNNTDYNSIAFDNKQRFLQLYEVYKSYGKLLKKKKPEILEEMRTYLIDIKKEDEKYSKLYEHIHDYQLILKNENTLKEMFSNSYIGIYDSNWVAINVASKKVASLHEMINSYRIISQCKVVIKDKEKIQSLIELKDNYNDLYLLFLDKLEQFIKISDYNSYLKFGYKTWYLDLTFNELKKVISGWKNNIDSVMDVVNYNSLMKKFIDYDLSPLMDLIPSWKLKNDYLEEILSFEYFDSLINYAYNKYPILNEFKKYKADRQVDLFKELDLKVMVENIKYILKKHWDNMPKINDDNKDMTLIRRELQKKRNHMPIRKLISKANESILKIKPVFMMSPISISSFLTPKEVVFDLVVFDEASQVRPVEAFGALLRAKQIVVVGDSKQLPPTSFFDTMTSKYDEMNDEDYDVSNMESILSLLLAKNIPQRTLNWHYRSKHQSLIMVSNSEFYQQSLKVFPSVNDKNLQEGLVFNYLPNTVYDRGGTRTNILEAKEVIKAVFKHAATNPNLSLGVASFSLAQQEELYKEFEKQLKKCNSDAIKEFFSSNKNEPFFIKNLENVQGDERDVIFISVGYGYDENHKITMEFGPLNKDGGERRLNVLITRAKYKCVVFSNITSHDINLSKTNASGVSALKKFLEYAQTRTLLKEKIKDVEVDNFVEYLYEKLLEYGYEADKNVGKNVGIDIAIFDAEKDKFVVGIECDGGINKVLESTTDRERIRRNVLKGLGWNLYHIWTPDYYRNPKTEFEQLLEYINDVVTNNEEDINKASTPKSIEIKRKQNNLVNLEKPKLEVKEYKIFTSIKRRLALLDEDETLSTILDKIVKCETPINLKNIKKRIMTIFNLNRLNEQVSNRITELLKNNSNIEIYNDFYLYKDKEIDIRNRSNLDVSMKKLENICDLEIFKAIDKLINLGLATTKEELYKQVAEALGLNKNNKLNEIINKHIEELIKTNKIYLDDEIIFVNDTNNSK